MRYENCGKRGCSKVVPYIRRCEFAHYTEFVDYDRCIYHIDDEYTFSESDLETPLIERKLIERADHVIIHSIALFEKKGGINPATTFSDVVMHADNSQSWLESLENELAPDNNTPSVCHKRQSTAGEYVWDELAKKIEKTIADLD